MASVISKRAGEMVISQNDENVNYIEALELQFIIGDESQNDWMFLWGGIVCYSMA